MTQETGQQAPKRGARITWRGALAILIGLLLLVFGVQNRESASIHFLGFQLSVSIWLLVLAVFLLGVVMGSILLAGRRKRRRAKPVKP